MVLGRRTWDLFASLWPTRSDPFSQRMNAMPKRVATRTRTDLSAWANSTPIEGDLLDAVRAERKQRDVIVTGSISVLRALQQADVIDQYRLLTFPSVIGSGERLFTTRIDEPLTRTSPNRPAPPRLPFTSGAEPDRRRHQPALTLSPSHPTGMTRTGGQTGRVLPELPNRR